MPGSVHQFWSSERAEVRVQKCSANHPPELANYCITFEEYLHLMTQGFVHLNVVRMWMHLSIFAFHLLIPDSNNESAKAQ